MSRFRRVSLGDQPGYTPGEQPPDSEGWVKLNTNEAPQPPSPQVAGAVAAAAAELRRYPDPFGEPLRGALATHHHVAPEQILVGNGADDILDCCFRAFCGTGDTLVIPAPTYSLLPILARQHGATVVELPLDEDHRVPPEVGAAPAALRVIVNPNAPTGMWVEPAQLEALLAPATGVSVIDEAYCDFAPASCVDLLPRHEGWLVVRTFSKSHALAGLRVGYAVGSPALVADLYAVKASYPVSRCSLAGATAALGDRPHHAQLVASVKDQRARLTARLSDSGWQLMPSNANFIFARPPAGDAAEVTEHLRSHRVLVRHFPADQRYSEWIRITVGTPGETDRLLTALASRA
jgi:histidinol-phosphate aminotransferase